MNSYSLSIAILAGGKSERIGKDKGFLLVKGQFFIEKIIRKVRKHTDNLFIISPNPRYRIYAPVYPDVIPGKDVLSGIYSALHYARHEKVLILPCDMPMFGASEIDKILQHQEEDYDAVLLRTSQKIFPFFGVYNTFSTKEKLSEILKKQNPNWENFLNTLNVYYVEVPASERLIDIDTKEDYLHLISNIRPKT